MKGLFTSFRKFKSAFELKVGCGFLKIREILKSAFSSLYNSFFISQYKCYFDFWYIAVINGFIYVRINHLPS